MEQKIVIKILQYSTLDFVLFTFSLLYNFIFVLKFWHFMGILLMFGHDFHLFSCICCKLKIKKFYGFVQLMAVFAIVYFLVMFYCNYSMCLASYLFHRKYLYHIGCKILCFVS